MTETFTLATPIGAATVSLRDGALTAFEFDGAPAGPPRGAAARAVAARLRAYFAGDVAAIDSLEVAAGGTPFQRAVWRELRRIPVGKTLSYAAVARRIGRPRAVRAVARANATNPVAVVVPCHRVIASDGTLCGYGGGLPRKQWLLAHEGAIDQSEVASAPAGAGASRRAALSARSDGKSKRSVPSPAHSAMRA